MDVPGGQCVTFYPDKLIHNISVFLEILVIGLIENRTQQAAPIEPKYHMGKTVKRLEDKGDV